MKRILVPTDFSPTAKKAFLYALAIANKTGGSVFLYHNYAPIENPFIDTEEIRKRENTQAKIELEKQLEELKEHARSVYADVPVSIVLDRAPLIERVLNFVNHNQIDLIVMGTLGASGLKKTIIGTVAARVVKKAIIPVLLVPEGFVQQEPEKIVFAADCKKTDREVLSSIFTLAKLYNSKLTVMHLCNAQEAENEKKDFDDYALDLKKEFSDFNLNFQLIKTTSPIESMKDFYKCTTCDLVVMIRRNKPFWERFFLESFTQQTAYASHIPLLVVPEINRITSSRTKQ